jgi:hypothetical protein
MRTTPSFLLSVFCLAVSVGSLAQDRNDSRWINEVKKTPVGQIETGLPQQSVATWFADLVRPNETDYEVKGCGEENDVDGNPRSLLCVSVYTKPPQAGWERWIQVYFVVAAIPLENTRDRAEPKPVTVRLLYATEGPTNPKSKRPERIFRKLSDLEKLVQGRPIS